jgi:hypothetical protein
MRLVQQNVFPLIQMVQVDIPEGAGKITYSTTSISKIPPNITPKTAGIFFLPGYYRYKDYSKNSCIYERDKISIY